MSTTSLVTDNLAMMIGMIRFAWAYLPVGYVVSANPNPTSGYSQLRGFLLIDHSDARGQSCRFMIHQIQGGGQLHSGPLHVSHSLGFSLLDHQCNRLEPVPPSHFLCG